MKKLYSLLASAFIGICAVNAASLQHSVSRDVARQFSTLDDKGIPASRSISFMELVKNHPQSITPESYAPSEAVADDWQSIGTGTYREGLLSVFSDIEDGSTYEIDIQENKAAPGNYRLLPYSKGPASELLGRADNTNYMYIVATDPEKAYFKNFKAFSAFEISHRVSENNWAPTSIAGYGTLKDGIFTIPANGAAVKVSGNWTVSNKQGSFMVALPGAEIKDYSIKLQSELCTNSDTHTITIQTGADVAQVAYMWVEGYATYSAKIGSIIALQGDKIDPAKDKIIDCPVAGEKHGLNSVLAVSLDAAGNVQGGAHIQFYINNDENDSWASIGTGKYTDCVYSKSYSDIPAETLDVEVQENKATKGYYRIVNPYKGHSANTLPTTGHNHNHYIYINAVDPQGVYVESSALGMKTVYGEGMIYSFTANDIELADEGKEQEALEQAKADGYCGTLSDNTITMPAGSLLLSEREYNGGAFLSVGGSNGDTKPELQLVLPDLSGIGSIITDESNAPVEYFNLQGVRIAEPQAGSLVIKRQGDKVSKVIVR